MNAVYSIGHSNHAMDRFIALLREHGVGVLVDVRSNPYSRMRHFGRERLAGSLSHSGVRYGWLGEQLGARRTESECHVDGRPDCRRILALAAFRTGIDRLLTGAEAYVIAIMCAEREPLDCHRTVLVCRALRRRGVRIRHILYDGSIEEHEDTENRLLGLLGHAPGLFRAADPPALVEEAYTARWEMMTSGISQREASEGLRIGRFA